MQSLCIALIVDDFVTNNLKTMTLVFALRDKKKEYTFALIKSTGIIKEFVDKNLYPLLDNKFSIKMWTILKDWF